MLYPYMGGKGPRKSKYPEDFAIQHADPRFRGVH